MGSRGAREAEAEGDGKLVWQDQGSGFQSAATPLTDRMVVREANKRRWGIPDRFRRLM